MINKVIRNQKVRDIIKITLFIVWLGAIFYFSSLSSIFIVESSLLDVIIKKIGHFFGYAFLLFFSFKVIRLNKQISFKYSLIYAFIFTFFYAIGDEIHQSFVPFRHPSIRDVSIDSSGALLAIFIIVKERKRQIKNPEKKHFIKI